MKENELSFRKRNQRKFAEDFISGLKKLFEEHYISVPDEKYDVLEDQPSKIESLENKLNEEIQKNVDLTLKQIQKKLKLKSLAKWVKIYADTAKEKFNKLAEEVEYTNEEDFKAKVSTIKESYFKG